MKALCVPHDKIVLRIVNSIYKKAFDQYESWKSKSWFNSRTPFIIAINSGDTGGYPEHIVSSASMALFGIKHTVIDLPTGATRFAMRDNVEKQNMEAVSVNGFMNDKLKHVSGIIFSNKSVINLIGEKSNTLKFINNPNSTHKISASVINKFG